MTIYTHGKVHIDDIDVSMEQTVETKDEAEELVAEESYRSEDSIYQDSDGDWVVETEPDASITTKRTVLKTMAKDRYGYLQEVEDENSTWVAGPVLLTILSSTPDADQDMNERKDDILDDMKNTKLDMTDTSYIIDRLMSEENIAN
jgi:hypothetical protein